MTPRAHVQINRKCVVALDCVEELRGIVITQADRSEVLARLQRVFGADGFAAPGEPAAFLARERSGIARKRLERMSQVWRHVREHVGGQFVRKSIDVGILARQRHINPFFHRARIIGLDRETQERLHHGDDPAEQRSVRIIVRGRGGPSGKQQQKSEQDAAGVHESPPMVG